jgi:hypothetical protein
MFYRNATSDEKEVQDQNIMFLLLCTIFQGVFLVRVSSVRNFIILCL